MSKKIFIKKNDASRVLHTEIFPYEIPIIFSNWKLYSYHRQIISGSVPSFIDQILNPPTDYSIPFEYQIWQGNKKRRVLSLIHPGWHGKFIDLYRDYGELILSQCKKSTYSLRHPSRVATYYFDRDYAIEDDALKTPSADQDPGGVNEQPRHAASYFYYAPYAQLYRFIDSPEFLSLESRYSRLIKFDIKRCFNSIYTHSISWAIKGKSFAKDNKGSKSFDSRFDELMQKVNYQETNGIVIGPEISRIFAEIVLQQIDLDIENQIEAENIGSDKYAIRRYVDDFFLFTRDSTVEDRIFEIAQSVLQRYKLFINESKTEPLQIPFVTPQTIAKTDVQTVLHGSILTWLNHLKKACKEPLAVSLDTTHAMLLKTPYKLAANLMRDLKIAVKRSTASFDVVTSYALGSVTQSLYRLHKAMKKGSLPEDRRTDFQNILIATVEVAFFFYSMDFRVRTTYLIAQFMLIMSKITKSDSAFHDLVMANMRAHVERVLESLPRDIKIGVEVHNLLIALKAVCPQDLLSPERLVNIVNPDWDRSVPYSQDVFNKSDYFDLIVLLHYVGDSSAHLNFKRCIEENILQRFVNAKDVVRSAELVFLLIDVISCPHIQSDVKRRIVIAAVHSITRKVPNDNDVGHIINFTNQNLGFVRWGQDIELEKLLMKKQLNPAY